MIPRKETTMNGATDIMRELDSSAWNEIRPDTCPCRNGWLLSDFDTWHRCHVHGNNVPHPNDESEEAEKFDDAKHSMEMWRQAYETFRNRAIRAGFKGNFKEACLGLLPKDDRTPKAWVDAAETLAMEASSRLELKVARAHGFSCALEMRLAEDATDERREAGRY
jgi:hypothetical protein